MAEILMPRSNEEVENKRSVNRQFCLKRASVRGIYLDLPPQAFEAYIHNVHRSWEEPPSMSDGDLKHAKSKCV